MFTPEESQMAQYRQLVNAGGITEDDEGGAWEGTVMACKDPFTWLFTSLHFFVIIGQSFKDFFPSVSSVRLNPLCRTDTDAATDHGHLWL